VVVQFTMEPGVKGITELVQRVPTWLSLSHSEKTEVRNTAETPTLLAFVHRRLAPSICVVFVLPGLLGCKGAACLTCLRLAALLTRTHYIAVAERDLEGDVALLRLRRL
jgi:hypothetical protein